MRRRRGRREEEEEAEEEAEVEEEGEVEEEEAEEEEEFNRLGHKKMFIPADYVMMTFFFFFFEKVYRSFHQPFLMQCFKMCMKLQWWKHSWCFASIL